ncbi:Protein translocase subunit SecA [Buchnera aphidicola (Pemphigus populi)]
MLIKILTKILGNYSNRILRRMQKIVDKINKIESFFEKLSDQELKKQTEIFRYALNKGISLDSLLPKAFATVREASKRVFNMRHFDVQLLGGIVLNYQCIAEMRTGEGKTLTATLPAYLHALIGKGVHIVTMNDYLAQRDAKKNKPLFEFLGLTVGLNLTGMPLQLKREAYLADITYGTNNEYGFDYLRDNMVFHASERVQRKLYYALIDEVDSILIDEARTPLIISGQSEDNAELYIKINKIIPNLIKQEKEDSDSFLGSGHFSVDEKQKQVYLTERGLIEIENLLVYHNIIKEDESLYSKKNIVLINCITSALRAHSLYVKNVDYIVKDNAVMVVDEHTGRIMKGRRWSDGLHQAIEAKEGVIVNNENKTLASITFQNYFRLYKKLAGMTGTAETESSEFSDIYNLDTVIIPTNRPMIRKDLPDLVFISEDEKIDAIIKDIRNCIKRKQPVLVGTISIEKSEVISSKLSSLKIKHNVLNAKFHKKEAAIISEAGQLGAVTIATNMAGRGTDIVLGGSIDMDKKCFYQVKNEKINSIKEDWKNKHNMVLSVGGLHIIGTERHESRRIDNQLRGRSGRQGDDGSSRFYLSMEDSLMRIFSSDRVISIMKKLRIKSGEPITHPFVTKAILNAQKKVENYNFDIRKQILEYDDVVNEQRRIIYMQRNCLVDSNDISMTVNSILEDVFNKIINSYFLETSLKVEDVFLNLENKLNILFNLKLSFSYFLSKKNILDKKKINDIIIGEVKSNYLSKEYIIGASQMRKLEKSVMLHTLDLFWQEHLSVMDDLKQGIHLRGYAQKDPKQEYQREAFEIFSVMLEDLKYEVILILSKIKISNLSDVTHSLFNFKNWQNTIYN